jgi:ribonuclease T1
MTRNLLLLLALALAACGQAVPAWETSGARASTGGASNAAERPAAAGRDPLSAVPEGERAEVRTVLQRIAAGGPFLHRRDGIVFANRERELPPEPAGYYREYTVETPGASDRGARRLVVGRGGEVFYSNDHYRSFVALGQAVEASR